KSQNSFVLHLANSNALISSYYLEYHKLNFKSLWIECVEPYFNDMNEFLNYAKKCVMIRSNFFTNYWILLHQALRTDMLSYSYCFDDALMKNLGLGEINIGADITGEKLKENFELLTDDFQLNEFKKEMRLYQNEQSKFIEKID